MKEFFAKIMTCFIFDKQKRKIKRHKLMEKNANIRLFMTLVVKDEEQIIEKNIRFHKAMGVDGFIVLNHDSTDNTANILEKLQKEGIVKEIINKSGSVHQHRIWVNELIKIAKKKYKADWVINADADEFFYSKDWDLKKSIVRFDANSILLDSTFFYPANDEENFLYSSYFIKKPLNKEMLEILNKKYSFDNQDSPLSKFTKVWCPKVIHKTKGFIKIEDGNHSVKMHFQREIPSSDIVLYHYYIKNYKEFEKKISKWRKVKTREGFSYLSSLYAMYDEGNLKSDYYDKYYGAEMFNILREEGVVVKDTSVVEFLEYNNI